MSEARLTVFPKLIASGRAPRPRQSAISPREAASKCAPAARSAATISGAGLALTA
jgi:hypothetical protein